MRLTPSMNGQVLRARHESGKTIEVRSQSGIMPTRVYRLQQRQRRINERRGVFVTVEALDKADGWDNLIMRAIWRRQGRALRVGCHVTRGIKERFLSP